MWQKCPVFGIIPKGNGQHPAFVHLCLLNLTNPFPPLSLHPSGGRGTRSTRGTTGPRGQRG
eukprot:5855255-Prorocentrum_lima.AAC.1